jgi:CPA2 family monovalent cation:H+ antiporter-2
VVVSFANTPKALAIIAHVRELRPELPVIVRTFDDSDVGPAARRRARRRSWRRWSEGSLMLATQTMMQLGVPVDQVLRSLREGPGVLITTADARLLSRITDERPPPMASISRCAPSWWAAPLPASARPSSACTWRRWRARWTAVGPNGTREVNPPPTPASAKAMCVVLLGTHENLAKAGVSRWLQG